MIAREQSHRGMLGHATDGREDMNIATPEIIIPPPAQRPPEALRNDRTEGNRFALP